MQKINEILNWNFHFSDTSSNTDKVITTETKNYIEKSIQELKNISENLIGGISPNDKKLIKDIYFLFKNNLHKEYSDLLYLFSKRDVRLLVLSLDYHPENGESPILFSKNLKTALKLVSDRWKDSFIVNLWHAYLKNWETLLKNKNARNILISFLNERSTQYKGERKDILSFNSNSELLLNNNSPVIYAKKLINSNLPIDEAHHLINQKEFILSYEYFSNVILKYINQIDQINIDKQTLLDIYLFINKHNSKRTTLLACSAIINDGKFNRFNNVIKNITISLIDDPIKIHSWSFKGLTEREEEFIENARKKLNALLNQQFIRIFFEELVKDPRRKKYWLSFYENINDVTFIGNKYNYSYLKSIDSISKHVNSRYKITKSRQSTCAIVIDSGNFIFVEFTDKGALYIYRKHNFNIDLNSVPSIKYLKNWDISKYAVRNSRRSGYVELNEEGRLTHQGDWEGRLDIWMRKYFKKSSLKQMNIDFLETKPTLYKNLFKKTYTKRSSVNNKVFGKQKRTFKDLFNSIFNS